MAKTNSNFKMSKTSKMLLAKHRPAAMKSLMKSMLISAQVAEAEASLKGQKGYLEMFKGRKANSDRD